MRFAVGLFLALGFAPQASFAQAGGISGGPMPEESDYRPLVQGAIAGILRDPDSARFEWSPPYQITCDKALYRTKKRWQGWAMDVNVNAKNGFGGYTGFKPYLIMFESDGIRLEATVHTSGGPFRWGICRREGWQVDGSAD